MAKRHEKFEIFRDGDGEFRWRLRAKNGKIVADSGEGYKKRKDCVRGMEITMRAGWYTERVDLT